jgi:hypothetical protein
VRKLPLGVAAATGALVAVGTTAGVAVAVSTSGAPPRPAALPRPVATHDVDALGRRTRPGGQAATARSRAAASQHEAAAGQRKPASKAGAGPQATPAKQAAPTPSASTTTPPAKAASAQPYLIYDSTTPAAIPANQVVATYVDGPHPTPVSAVAGRQTVFWIDVDGSDPQAQVIDVEPGCATPAAAASWVPQRLSADPGGVAIIYTAIAEWPSVQAAVASLPASTQARIRWWIADPTGTPHIVPGSAATQWYWGPSYDISTATAAF